MRQSLESAVMELTQVLQTIAALAPTLQRVGEMFLQSWQQRGKVMTAGNGGSAADAMHLAEELAVRYARQRRALAAMALCDPTVLTCAANDLGFEHAFARQVEALGNPGDVLVVFTTSGNSPSILNAVTAAKSRGVHTVAFLGKGGGALRGQCDIELLIPSATTARVQEAHQLLYHVLCDWVEQRV